MHRSLAQSLHNAQNFANRTELIDVVFYILFRKSSNFFMTSPTVLSSSSAIARCLSAGSCEQWRSSDHRTVPRAPHLSYIASCGRVARQAQRSTCVEA